MTTKTEAAATTPVPNPCVGVCALDENDICVACHRHGIEIGEWGVLTDDQKREVWAKIARREKGEIC